MPSSTSTSKPIPTRRRPSSKSSPSIPGASAEEVERQVTIPLEVALAGMPGLKYTRSKSLFGLAHLRNQFEYGVDYEPGRAGSHQPPAVHRRSCPPASRRRSSPASPTGEICRYTLTQPQGPAGPATIYTLNDLKALQDWVLEREFRRVPRIVGRGQLRRHGQALRGPSRPGPAEAATASRSTSCRTPSPTATPTSAATTSSQATTMLRCARHRPDRRRPGSDACRPPMRMPRRPRRSGAITPPRGGTPRCPRDPPDRHHLDQQRAGPRRGRRRGGPLRYARRVWAKRGVVVGHQTRQGRVGMSRRMLDEAGNGVRRRGRQTACGSTSRQGAGHRAAAQGRGIAAGPARRRSRRSRS